MNSPLSTDGSNFPCKGYHSDFDRSPAGDPTATWAAGSPQKVTLDDSAAHGGGSCQLSLSYDGGKTFRVIKSIEGNCVDPNGGKHSFDFTVPDDAKSGKAIFAWSWFNHIGNREMYMNCAAVTISGTGTSTLDDRPEIFKANIKNDNNCKVAEGTDVKFPNPGPDLEVLSEANLSPPTCDQDPSSPSPDESANPIEPDEPTDSADPTDSAAPTEPAEPTESADPDPTNSAADSTNSANPTDSADPYPTNSADSTSSANPTNSAAPTDSDAPTEVPVSTSTSNAAAPSTTPPSGTTYTVKGGDICVTIATQLRVSLATLFKLNPAMYVLTTKMPVV